MKTAFEQLKEFHDVYECYSGTKPHLPANEIRQLRVNLLKEEWAEYLDAEANDDLVEIADALADMVYICLGTAVAYGIPFDKIWEEVHASNMSKLDSDGRPIRREDGKVLKGPRFFEPKIETIIKQESSSFEKH